MTTVTKTRPAKSDEQLAAEAAAKAEAAAYGWTSALNAVFFSDTIKKGRGHAGRFTLSASNNGYRIIPTDDGKKHFVNRRKETNALTGDMIAGLDAFRSNKSGRFSNRDFTANAGRIAGKAVALPKMSGSGDALQQFIFASLVINSLP